MLNGRYSWMGGVLLLVFVVIAANYNIVFLGQSLVSSANYHPFDYRTTQMRPGTFHGGYPFANWHDQGCVWWQWEPAAVMYSHAFRAGRVPLWGGAVGGGTDLHTQLTQGQYYPPYVLLLLAGNTPLERDFYYLIQLFASGLFCYLLLRRHGCHAISAVAMGTAYMLSGPITQNVNSIIGQSFAVLPVMVWAADRVLSRPTWRSAGVAALVLAIAALSSFLPVVISGYLLVGLYGAVDIGLQAWTKRRTGGWGPDWRRAGKVVAAIGLSVVIASFIILPAQIASSRDILFQKWYPAAGLQHLSLTQMMSLVSPSIGFDIWQQQDPSIQLFAAPTFGAVFYVGLVPILLAFFGIPKAAPRLNKLLLFFFLAAALMFLKLLGAVPVQWLGLLPVFRNLHFIPYFFGALAYGVAGLTGLGIERFIRERDRLALGLGCILVVAVFVAMVRFAQTVPVNPRLQGPTLSYAVARHAMEVSRLGLLAAGFLAVVLLRRKWLQGPSAGALLLALIFLDLAPLGARSRFLRSDVWSNPPEYVRFLQQDHGIFRVHGTHDLTLTANVSQAYGIQVLSSRMPFNSSPYSQIIRKYFTAPDLPFPLAQALIPTKRELLDVLNVKYLLVFAPSPTNLEQLASVGFVPKFRDGEFRVLENQRVWPRAYLASSVRLAASDNESLEALASLEPGQAVVREKPHFELQRDDSGVAEIERYDYDSIVIRARTKYPSLLVVGENSADGWSATVQNRPVKITAANYAFQAVEVPAGESEVRLTYMTPGLPVSLAASTAGLMVAVCLILVPWRRIGRHPSAAEG